MYKQLGVSLEKLLEIDTFKDARVIAGKGGMNSRITKVNVMEVPDIVEWVSPGELLITTAYSIKDNIDILVDLIPKLKEKGVVGLGIKVGRYVDKLPEYIIQLADERDFPILELPFCISHTDVISSVLTELINEQMNMLIKIDNFNRELMNIMIKGGNLQEIGKKLYDNIENSIAIYENLSDDYEVISDNLDKSSVHHIIFTYLTSSKTKLYEEINIAGEYQIHKDNISGKIIDRITIPLIIEDIEYGCIFIWLDKKILTPLDKMLLESYKYIIALEFVKRMALNNIESNHKSEFFDDLLSSNEDRQKIAVEKYKIFNFNKELNYSVIIISIKNIILNHSRNNKNTNYIQEFINNLLFIINRISKTNKEKIIYVDKSDRIIVLYGSEKNKNSLETNKEILNFCNSIIKQWEYKFDKDKLTIGVGRAFKDHKLLYKSYEQGNLIVEHLSKAMDKDLIHYDDLGVYRILSYDELQGELSSLYNETVEPLIQYDKLNNSELVKTLKYYFKYNGNMKKLSEKMYVHYNTIIYRIQKIMDITGINIEDSDSRLNLEIALKFTDLVKNTKD